MKYTIQENADLTYTLLRHGVRRGPPTNAELEFWLELEAQRTKIAEYDSQFAKMGQYLSGDARNYDGTEESTFANFVIQEFDKLKAQNDELCRLVAELREQIAES